MENGNGSGRRVGQESKIIRNEDCRGARLVVVLQREILVSDHES